MEMFTWYQKPHHISMSRNFFYFPTKQITEIGGEQIFIAKYKFQVLVVAKVQGLEHTLFFKGTSIFLRHEALLPLVQKLWEMSVNPWKCLTLKGHRLGEGAGVT